MKVYHHQMENYFSFLFSKKKEKPTQCIKKLRFPSFYLFKKKMQISINIAFNFSFFLKQEIFNWMFIDGKLLPKKKFALMAFLSFKCI